MSSKKEPIYGTTDLKLIQRMMYYVGAHKKLFVLTMLIYPISAASVAIPPYLVQQMLDVALPAKDLNQLTRLALVYLVVLGFDYLSGFLSQFLMTVLGQRAMKTLRSHSFAKVQRLGASYFDKNPSGKVLTRLTNDVEALSEFFSSGAVTIVADVMTILGIVVMMLWLDVKMTLFSFLVVPILLAISWFFQKLARQAFRAVRRHLATINAFLAEHLSGMNVVQVFGQENRTSSEFHALNVDYRDANYKAVALDASLFAIVEAIGTTAVALMIWYGAKDLSDGLVGAGVLVAFIQYIRRFFIPIRDLAQKYTLLQSAFAAAERIFDLLDEKESIPMNEGLPKISTVDRGLELRDVWFSYKENEDWVLEGLDLQVKRGEHIALVGPTGSGKTTVLKLLNRLYDVQRGDVLIDGVNLKNLELKSVRKIFAVVLQDVYLFRGTIMDNLSLNHSVSSDKVIEAAKLLHAHHFIERLPRGYDTEVKELGSDFSAGERQLLAFVRALALGPEIIVLDEATSNVDLATERKLQEGLRVLMKNRTAIIVAHRLSTVREVDRIVVLRHGKIVEEGSHRALINSNGVYAQLARLQFGFNGN